MSLPRPSPIVGDGGRIVAAAPTKYDNVKDNEAVWCRWQKFAAGCLFHAWQFEKVRRTSIQAALQYQIKLAGAHMKNEAARCKWKMLITECSVRAWQFHINCHSLTKVALQQRMVLLGAQCREAEERQAKAQAEAAQANRNLCWTIQQADKELADARGIQDSLRSNVAALQLRNTNLQRWFNDLEDTLAEVEKRLKRRRLYDVIFPHMSPQDPSSVPARKTGKKGARK